MKTKIIKTDWSLDERNYEGSVLFKGKQGYLIHAFSFGLNYEIGEEIDLKEDLNALHSEIDLDVVFSNNPNKELKINHIKNWEYECYGRILQINPVIVDFGEFILETGNWTNDNRAIGEHIYWKIDRLELYFT